MCGEPLREKKTNAELRESMGTEKISDVMRRSRLRWMGHVLRKEGNNWVKKSMEMTVEGSRGRGRPKITWEKVAERDMKVWFVRNDAKDGVKWRALSLGAKGKLLQQWEKWPQNVCCCCCCCCCCTITDL